MNLKQAYEFLKPSLDQCTQEEKREFCQMIMGEPGLLQKRKKTSTEESRLKRIAEKKRKLLKTGLFKN